MANLYDEYKENNILITINGFLIFLLIPFAYIVKSNIENLESLYENKIKTQRVVTYRENIIKTKIYRTKEAKEKLILIKTNEKHKYKVYEGETFLGEGSIMKNGTLLIDNKIYKLYYYYRGNPLNIDLSLSFLSNGDIVFKHDMFSNKREDEMEKNIVKFLFQAILVEEEEKWRNKFVKDKKIIEYIKKEMDKNALYSIKKIKLYNKELKIYKINILKKDPRTRMESEENIYITLGKDDSYVKYNSFRFLIKKISIIKIRKEEEKKYKKHIEYFVESLFKTKDIFKIEILLQEENASIKDKKLFYKNMMDIRSIQIINNNKTYDYNKGKEKYIITYKDLEKNENKEIIVMVSAKIKITKTEKKMQRKIVNIFLKDI